MPTLPYADPGTPDLRSPLRFLGWVGRRPVAHAARWRPASAWCGWSARRCSPRRCRRAIDEGIVAGDNGRLLLWGGVLLVLGAVGAVTGALRHRFAVTNWLAARLPRHAAGRLQGGRRRRRPCRGPCPTGEVVATVASDAMRVGGLYDVMRPVRRRGRQLRRRRASCCSPPRRRSAWSCWSACRCSSARLLADRAAAAAPPGRPARGVRPADHPRRRHRRRPARAARHRRRADLPAPLRGAVPAGARRSASGWPAIQAALDAAQVLLPGIFVVARDLARRPLRHRGRDQRRASSWRSTATRRSSSCRCAPRPSSSTAPPAPTSAPRKIIRVLAVQPDDHRTPPDAGDRAGRGGAALADPRQRRHVEPRPADRRRRRRAPRSPPPWPTGWAGSGRPRTPVTWAACRSPTCRWRPSAAAWSSARPTPGCSPAPLREELDPSGVARRRQPLARGAVGRERRGRPGGAARRAGQRGRGARPVVLRRPAPAPRAGPGAADRRRDAGAGRAHERGGRPHRGPDRRAPARTAPRAAAPPWSSPPARCCWTTPTRCCSCATAGSAATRHPPRAA